MPEPRLGATPRFRLLATICTCSAGSCPCSRTRDRAAGSVHCPICKSASPVLSLDLRGAELRARCSAGCDPARVQALADGDDRPLLALYGDTLSNDHARLLLESAVA